MEFRATSGTNITLINYDLYKENGRLWLYLKYRIEDNDKTLEVVIPKVDLKCIPIKPEYLACNVEYRSYAFPDDAYIIINSGRFGIDLGDTEEVKNVFFTEKVLEEKRKEMTLEEIEKKLGYKIKIVSEK